MTRPKDWGAEMREELQRLGIVLHSKTIQYSDEALEYTLTDRQATLTLRRVRPDRISGCWRWAGALNDKGYGIGAVHIPAAGGSRNLRAHRLIFMLLKGSIPAGLTLDHLCFVRHCVNPAHLDPCAAVENMSRSPNTAGSINRAKMRCPRGHQYDRIYIRASGSPNRRCSTCDTAECRERRRRRKAAAV